MNSGPESQSRRYAQAQRVAAAKLAAQQPKCSGMEPDEFLLLTARNQYQYPWVYLDALGGNMVKGVDHPRPSTEAQVALMSDTLWVERHQRLLSSAANDEVLLGLVSINYWGYYGSSSVERRPTPARALARARWVRDGRPNAKGPVPLAAIAAQVRLAREHLGAGHLGQALQAINQAPEFGQMSFGSKVLMAMAPEQCGVYDSIIFAALQEAGPTWASYVAHPNQGMNGHKAEVYQRWCELLAHRAQAMNDHGVDVSGWRPSGERNTQRQAWRAVDVERAFFHAKDVAVLGAPIH